MLNNGTPSLALAQIRVRDCMHKGVLTCAPDDSLQEVAATMAKHRVHAVVITAPSASRPLGVVSDLDVVAGVAAGANCTASQAAATESVTISGEESLGTAAQLMTEHGVSHLVVVDRADGYPVGVLSTLDVVSLYASS